MKLLSHVRLLATPLTVAYQAPPSMGFSRQECWSGLPFPSPGDLPNPGIEPRSPSLQADALPFQPPGGMDACNKNRVVFFFFLSLNFSGHWIVLRQTRKTGNRKKKLEKGGLFIEMSLECSDENVQLEVELI